MKRFILAVALAAVAMLMLVATASAATIIVDDTTHAYYNYGLGDLQTAPPAPGEPYYFPSANVANGDPTQVFTTAPDLSNVTALGTWLGKFAPSGGAWSSGLEPIPASTYPGLGFGWDVNTETAISYRIDIPLGGATNVVAAFGVDNGLYVWLNGAFVGGAMAGGYFTPGEYSYNLGSLSAGTHYLQVLREDHGGYDGYTVNVTGDIAGHGWNGFFDPVKFNEDDGLNLVNAGRAIPMKFSLGGDFGLDIFAAGYPMSHQITCPGGTPVSDTGIATDTAGGSTLQYDASTDTYTYVWKTEKVWAGQCREFDLLLKGDPDSAIHFAQFQFK